MTVILPPVMTYTINIVDTPYFIVIVDHRIVVGDSSEIFGFRDQDPSYARSPFKPINIMEIQIVIKAMMMTYYFERVDVSSSQRDGFR